MTTLVDISQPIYDSLIAYTNDHDCVVVNEKPQHYTISIMNGAKINITVIPFNNIICGVILKPIVEESLLPNNKLIQPGIVHIQTESDIHTTLIPTLKRLHQSTRKRIINHITSNSWWSISAAERIERVSKLIESMNGTVVYNAMTHTLSYKAHVMHIKEFDDVIKIELSIGNCTVRDIHLESAIRIINHFII